MKQALEELLSGNPDKMNAIIREIAAVFVERDWCDNLNMYIPANVRGAINDLEEVMNDVNET